MRTLLLVETSAALSFVVIALVAGLARADPVCPPEDPPRPESDIIGFKEGCPIFKGANSKPKDKPPPVQRNPPDNAQRKTSSNPWFKSQDCAALKGFEAAAKLPEIDTIEYSFLVVMEPDPAGGKHFSYTDPVPGERYGTAKTPVPRGVIFKAYNHTHPKRYSFQGFSPDDLDHYRELNAQLAEVAWYLRTPLGPVIKATSVEDFPHGKSVSGKDCQ